MAVLSDILYRVGLREIIGSTQREISSLAFDSRKVEAGGLFIAIRGLQTDGHRYIEQALEKGALAVVCEKMPDQKRNGITYVLVRNSSEALGYIAANFYGNPSEKLMLIGVTGTNGKTTVATLLYRLFRQMGYPAGLISTVENRIEDRVVAAEYTTPDALSINRLLKAMVDEGCQYAAMEVSSHALDQNRAKGLYFKGGLFTNITHDHLDYHKTFDRYLAAKKKLFDDLPSDAFALVNADDKHGRVMLQNTAASKYRYALKEDADFRARVLENTLSGMMLKIGDKELHSLLIGEFNAYNLLSVYAAALLLGLPEADVLPALSSLKAAEGRFEYFHSGEKGIVGIVDYAHTPDALEKILETIRSLRTEGEAIITVVGCGGNRDKAKRPVMAKVAARLSEKVVLTSDNPRNEDPQSILEDMKQGLLPHLMKKVLTVSDRREAIRTACSIAGSGDIILLAGKGHEKYQEIDGKKLPFDDREVLKESFKEMQK